MKKRSRFFRLTAGAVLWLALWGGVGTVTLAPTPAYAVAVIDSAAIAAKAAEMAENVKNWLINNALSKAINTALTGFWNSIISKFDKAIYDEAVSTATEMAAQNAAIKLDADLTQAKLDSRVEDEYLEAAGSVALKYRQPKGQDLCNNILVAQMPASTEQFERDLTKLIMTSIETMYRGENADGSGPQYALDHHQMRCKAKLGNPIDYPDSCVDSSTTGTDGRKKYDADLKMSTLDGSQVLELPEFATVEIEGKEFRVPNPQNAEQEFWTAGFYFCVNLAGPRPSPPYGAEMDTPTGRTKRVKWDQCAAKQSKMVLPCAKLLAHNTRPNTKYMAELISTQKTACEAAKKLNVKLPDHYKNCVGGLSAYESKELERLRCKNPQTYIAMTEAGSPDPKMMDASVECSMAWSVSEENEISLKSDLIDGVNGLLGLKSCWKGAEK